MVIEAVVRFLLGAAETLVDLLPTGDVPDFGTSAGEVVGFFRGLDAYLPVTEILAGVTLLLGMYGLLFGYRVLKEVRSWVPFL
jgi:hypothetical protein